MNDGVGIVPNTTPHCAPNVAEHWGVPVWQNPALTAMKKICRLAGRRPEIEQLQRVAVRSGGCLLVLGGARCTQVAQKLLEFRADPDYGERRMGRTPLWKAAWSEHMTMI